MIRSFGTIVANYSTDDPWNPRLVAPWFLSALPAYDVIFTPRSANIDDFRNCGVKNIHFVPFGYDPDTHRPWPEKLATGVPSDVLFVGGCDEERLPLIRALANAGLSLALYGRYWDQDPVIQKFSRGIAT